MYAIGRVRKVELEAAELGFRFTYPKFGSMHELDTIGLAPLEDNFPVYSRDAELFAGTLQDVEKFLHGIRWITMYYTQLKLVDDEKVKRKEQDYRNRNLIDIIANNGDNNGTNN
jgi:hypothetical protein